MRRVLLVAALALAALGAAPMASADHASWHDGPVFVDNACPSPISFGLEVWVTTKRVFRHCVFLGE